MGAVFVRYSVEGYSARECFDKLKKEYIREYGNSGYTGTIASCILGGKEQTYDKPNLPKIKKFISDFANAEYIDKGVLSYIDAGVVSYDEVKVKLIKSKNKPVYNLMYCIRDDDMIHCKETILSKAEEKLISMAKYNKELYLTKEYVLTDCCSVVSTPELTIKSHKRKPKTGIYQEKHLYYFFGYAPE